MALLTKRSCTDLGVVNSATGVAALPLFGIMSGNTSATIDGAQVSLGGDIITEVDGKKVKGMEELIAAVDAKKPGDEIEVTLLRGGNEKTVTVTLANRPASIE